MPRYADIDKLLEEFDAEAPTNWNDTEAEIQEQTDFRYYRGIVENAPTADVVEVKHGKWKEHFGFGCWHYDCPLCDDGYATKEKDKTPPNYCGNCGAKMDGKVGEQG